MASGSAPREKITPFAASHREGVARVRPEPDDHLHDTPRERNHGSLELFVSPVILKEENLGEEVGNLGAAILESEITVPPRIRLFRFAVLGSHTDVDSATHCAAAIPRSI